jgi:methylaspartate mutase epsilon subunit
MTARIRYREVEFMDSSGQEPYRVAVVGSGPRGVGVLERLASRLLRHPPRRPVALYLIDAVEVGCGRIWRSDQPEWFLMNTVCGEVTMFSGPPDDGAARPGAGPSLAQWWQANDPDFPGKDGYAPRARHGRYLRYVVDVIESSLPANVRLERVEAAVLDLEPTGDGYRLALSTGASLRVDRAVLTTGHARLEPAGAHRELAEFAAARPHLRYFPSDSVADMPLESIPDGSTVGFLGIGLSFYDAMLALTVGRGGRFVGGDDADQRYVPSGQEPILVAGSRSGIPLPGRGRNQKPATLVFTPTLFTTERVCRGRARGTIDFDRDVLPWILAEVELVYYRTELRERAGSEAEDKFTSDIADAAAITDAVPDIRDIAIAHGGTNLPPLDFERLARPFAGRTFACPAEFDAALTEYMRDDLARADRGNYADPVKAALDVLRDTRWVVREISDFGGLTPRTHRDDFLGRFAPRSALLAAGPPRIRLRQAMALRAAGILRTIGPDARFACDSERDVFVVSSPSVAGSAVEAHTLIDARVPDPNVHRDPSPLTRNLLARGIWTTFSNGTGPDAFHTGGVAVTRSPFHPVDRQGRPNTDLHVLGIPTEHTRWFTFVGSGRPGPWNEFTRDADAIARATLRPVADDAAAAQPADGVLVA